MVPLRNTWRTKWRNRNQNERQALWSGVGGPLGRWSPGPRTARIASECRPMRATRSVLTLRGSSLGLVRESAGLVSLTPWGLRPPAAAGDVDAALQALSRGSGAVLGHDGRAHGTSEGPGRRCCGVDERPDGAGPVLRDDEEQDGRPRWGGQGLSARAVRGAASPAGARGTPPAPRTPCAPDAAAARRRPAASRAARRRPWRCPSAAARTRRRLGQ